MTQRNEPTQVTLELRLRAYISDGNCKKTKKLLTEYSDRINSADNSGRDGEEGRLFGLGLSNITRNVKAADR